MKVLMVGTGKGKAKSNGPQVRQIVKVVEKGKRQRDLGNHIFNFGLPCRPGREGGCS